MKRKLDENEAMYIKKVDDEVGLKDKILARKLSTL